MTSRSIVGIPPRAARRASLVSCLGGLCLLALATLGCRPDDPSSSAANERAAAETPGTDTAAADTAAKEPSVGDAADEAARAERVVVFLGDSLTAGYGLDPEEAYPALVGAALRDEGLPVRVVNAGVSGDTTAGGLRRLDWILRQDPDVVVVVLGGNDGLRGLDLDASEENLRQIVERARGAGARVLLGGMLLPPSYGDDYTGRFAAIYPRVAEELDVALIPFVLEGVGGVPELNLPDGIHPNAAGQDVLAGTVLEHLRPLLERPAPEEGAEDPTTPAARTATGG